MCVGVFVCQGMPNLLLARCAELCAVISSAPNQPVISHSTSQFTHFISISRVHFRPFGLSGTMKAEVYTANCDIRSISSSYQKRFAVEHRPNWHSMWPLFVVVVRRTLPMLYATNHMHNRTEQAKNAMLIRHMWWVGDNVVECFNVYMLRI